MNKVQVGEGVRGDTRPRMREHADANVPAGQNGRLSGALALRGRWWRQSLGRLKSKTYTRTPYHYLAQHSTGWLTVKIM